MQKVYFIATLNGLDVSPLNCEQWNSATLSLTIEEMEILDYSCKILSSYSSFENWLQEIL